MLTLVIGNKKYSSWSLRGWLALKLTGAPFEEIVVGLDLPDTAAQLRKHSPSGRVPVLLDDALTIWDSLSIAEYLAEKFPAAQLWPGDAARRAHARSICAEMHSGFPDLRNDCSMRILEDRPMASLRPETANDVKRVIEIWEGCLSAHGGPFLFGARPCVADAFYAPVVSRFRTYHLPTTPQAQRYLDAIGSWAPMQAWVDGAKRETLRAARHE